MPFKCNICNLNLNSQEQLNQHFSGTKHTRAANGLISNAHQAQNQNKVEDIKSAGLKHFVKADSSSQNARNQQDPMRNSLLTTPQDCSNASVELQGSSSDNGTYCIVCRMSMTSAVQAQIHYAGAKHRQKVKMLQLEEDEQRASVEFQKVAAKASGDSDDFCSTCNVKITSKSQAEMHYTGSKHKYKRKLLEEKKTNQAEGEPVTKKGKLVQICETCNVKLTCPDMAEAHFNGSKHKKKVAMLKQIAKDQGSMPATIPHQEQFSQQPAYPTQEGVKKGGHLYCSFCDVTMNSQAQMDVHRSASRHKAKVLQISKKSKPQVRRPDTTGTANLEDSTSEGFMFPMPTFPLPPLSLSSPPPPPPSFPPHDNTMPSEVFF